LIIGIGLPNFIPRIHHERPPSCDGLADGLSLEKEVFTGLIPIDHGCTEIGLEGYLMVDWAIDFADGGPIAFNHIKGSIQGR
jgi:hypothetical protein